VLPVDGRGPQRQSGLAWCPVTVHASAHRTSFCAHHRSRRAAPLGEAALACHAQLPVRRSPVPPEGDASASTQTRAGLDCARRVCYTGRASTARCTLPVEGSGTSDSADALRARLPAGRTGSACRHARDGAASLTHSG